MKSACYVEDVSTGGQGLMDGCPTYEYSPKVPVVPLLPLSVPQQEHYAPTLCVLEKTFAGYQPAQSID